MAYVIFKESRSLRHFLSNDNRCWIATNNAKKFDKKYVAIEYARALVRNFPGTIWFVLGPRNGITKIK